MSQSESLTSDYVSGSMTIQGLGWNGTNFADTIAKLKKIEEIPARRLLKWKADWQERQEAFRIVRQQLVSLREVAAKMSSIDTFLAKGVSSAKPDVATATAKSNAQEGVYKLEVNQLATNSIWSIDTGFADIKTKVNAGSSATNFSYQYAGKTRTLSIAPGTTLEGLANLINNDAQNPGVRVSLIKGADGYTFQMRGVGLGSENELHITYADLASFPPAGDYEKYSFSMNTGLAAATDSVNTSGKPQEFAFVVNGKRTTLSIASGTTLEALRDKINASGSGNIASIGAAADGKMTLKFDAPTGTAINVIENKDSGLVEGLRKVSDPFTPRSDYRASISTGLSTPQDMVNTSGGVKNFVLTHGGVQYTLPVPNDTTLNDFVEFINSNTASTNVRASLSTGADGKQVLNLSSLDGKPITVAADPALSGITAIPTYTEPTSSGWYVQQSQDAKIRVNGWPSGSWLSVSSNTVDNVTEGMTFNLKDVGTTTLTVATDAAAIKENVLSFIDAVNTFRATILELTKLDANKATVDPKYAKSLYDMQKGSILTGNYGVQLLSSQIKQATAGMPLGFMPQKKLEGYLTGDIFTSLSQLGIKTDATGSGGANFGMLVLNTDPSLPTLDEVLAKNPEAVAEFFAAKNKGVSDSPNFSFSSQIESITAPGAYNVTYDVDGSGNILNAYINGKKARYYPETGEIGLVRSDPSSSDSSVLTATTNGTVEGNYTIEVLGMAKGASLTIDTGFTGASADAIFAPPTSSNAAVATAVVDNTTATHNVTVSQLATGATQVIDTGLTGASPAQVLSTTTQKFTFEINGTSRNVSVLAGETLEGFVNRINGQTGSPVTASMENTGGSWKLAFQTKETGADVQLQNFTTPLGTLGTNAIGKDAQYSIDGGATQTSKTNTVAKPASGITSLTLKSTGTTTIESAPVASREFSFTIGGKNYTSTVLPGENLDQFVARINASKNSPVTVSIDNSGGTWELKFQSKETGSDVQITGFASTLTNMQSVGASTPGTDARYTVNGGAVKTSKTNTVTNAVNGLTLALKKTGISSLDAQKYNDADGIIVHPDNLTLGSYNGTVRIKQGKINELMRLLDGPPSKPEEGMLGSKGALQILQDNYDKIIAGIDAKVEREDVRITKWERLMKMRFARLDATLKQYDGLNKSIAAQIKTLGGNSSS